MGSPDGEGEADEHPQREVTLSAYCFDRTEVTAGAYSGCVRVGNCTAPAGDLHFGAYGVVGREHYPVNDVNWNQATAYCAWVGGRLPTEAEWEYAARGPEGRRYPWGDAEPAGVPWDPNAAVSATVPRAAVGTNPWGRSWVGVEDLAGSMWEWVSDRYGAYPGGAVSDPRGAARGDRRVLRGGGWGLDQRAWMRGAIRLWNTPLYRTDFVGFRCACAAN